jgi:hypothetical protein
LAGSIVLAMQTKLTFFKSYYKLGWWAARLPKGEEWTGHEVGLIGFGVTQTQAERDLLEREQAHQNAEAELAA